MKEDKNRKIKCVLDPFLNIKFQMLLNRLLDFSLLDSDVPLCDGGAAVLQEMLDEGNVIAAVSVNLGGVELSE